MTKTPVAQPITQAQQPFQKLKAYRQSSNRTMLKAAIFGSLMLGTFSTVIWYGVTGKIDLGLGLLGACGGATVAVGSRAFVNQPASAEALALVVQALEEQATDAQVIANQLKEHRRAAGDLQRDLAASRKETKVLSAELSTTNQQFRNLSSLVRELLAAQAQQPKAKAAEQSAPMPVTGSLEDEWELKGEYWDQRTEVSHAA